MELRLYTNNSADNVVTKNITSLTTLNGTLRENCSIVDPVITVENINNAIAAVCNYAFIPQFARYYFVRNITLSGKLWIISMHVDVLASFQTPLKSLDAVIARNENRYNLYLQDGFFKTYQNPHVSIKQFPAGFTTHNYILAVAGAGGYTPGPTNLQAVNESDNIESEER